MAKTFNVTLPIAGHAYVTVEADSETDAINKAIDEVSHEDIEDWSALRRFNSGNVCHCPSPWEAEAEEG